MTDPGGPRSSDGRPRRPCDAQGRVRRPARLLGLTTRTACEATALKLSGRLTGPDATAFHARTAERYARLLGHSKGVVMKVGQMLSFGPPNFLVTPEHLPIYQKALAQLCTEAPAMEPELACAVLEHELGPIESSFASFDPEPFAAASIGQVHAAELHDGREVAVKIQYPEAFAAIAADLKNIELLAGLVELLENGTSLRRTRTGVRAVAREVRTRVSEELDYRLEASSQEQFARGYRGHPFIHVPEVVHELCTGKVLCQELVKGLSWNEALTAGQDLRDRWAEAIFRFVHGSGTRFGAFHADPHPGNYVFHEDGGVSFLDFGCVKRFTPEQARYKATVGLPCSNGDVLGTWQACVQTGLLREYDPVTPEEAFAFCRNYLNWIFSDTPVTLTPARVAEWMERCFSLQGPSSNLLRYSTVPPVYTLLVRIELGTVLLIAHLRACIDWRSLGAECVMDASPLTEMGRLERDYFDSHA